MLRALLRSLVALALAGCATSPVDVPPSSSPTEPADRPPPELVKTAYRLIQACLDDEARKLDDGRSDARTVATAVVSRCDATTRKAQLVIFWTASASDRQELFNRTRPGLIDRSTAIVLELRAKRR